ncbi:MAG: hypothetical protein ACXVKA_12725 [Acidimicrobiia bacterium]
MTNRRKPAQRSTGTAWKPTRPRSELYKAIGASGGIVVLTALLIFLMKPGDSTTPSTSVPVTTQTQPGQPTDTTPATGATSSTLPTSSTTTATAP